MSVNFILYVFFCGQGRALSLRYDIEFNLIAAANRHISVNYYGGSKPLPYRVGYIFSIRAKHPLLFTFHCSFSLSCVKGAGLLWRPLHLMQKHRPNRQVRRWVAARQLGGIVKQKSRTTARVVPTVAYIARQYTHPITFDFGKRMQSVLPFGIFVSQNSVASLTVFLPYFSFIESIAFSIFSRLICFSMSKNISS